MIKYDSACLIGDKHDMCQDYIKHGTINRNNADIPYIILSDGCGSLPDTDIGSRLLTLCAEKCLHSFDFNELIGPNDAQIKYVYDRIGRYVIDASRAALSQLPTVLPWCLNATLIVMFKFQNKIYVAQYGDGSIFTCTDDDYTIHTINFLKNTPYYLNLQYDEGYNKQYLTDIGDRYLLDYTDKTGTAFTSEALSDRTLRTFDVDAINRIYITSDGIDSFINKQSNVEYMDYDIINKFAEVKNINGTFIKRLIKNKNGIINNLKKENIINTDDLAIGCFVNIKE